MITDARPIPAKITPAMPFWYAWGWLFYRHYAALKVWLDRHGMHSFRWKLWPKKKALVKVWWRYRLVQFLTPLSSIDCRHCGYRDATEHSDLFNCTAEGGPDMDNSYWWEGIQTCARCGDHFEYSDGS